MKWLAKEPTMGDLVRTKLGELYHYGVYASRDEVIQFGLAPTLMPHRQTDEIAVLTSDLAAFSAGGVLEVAEPDAAERTRTAEDAVAVARSRIGERGYDILRNNCEHFARECVTGVRYSSQSDGLREMLRRIPVVNVFWARIPEGALPSEALFPPERQAEVESASHPRVKREKYYAWRLLAYALERSLGLRVAQMTFSKTEHGKWTSPDCFFSLSHTDGVVAVAVSRAPVGVDVERLDIARPAGLEKRILTARELASFEALAQEKQADYLIGRWSAKEAWFKAYGGAAFKPTEIEPLEQTVRNGELVIDDGVRCCYAVATETPERLRIYDDVSLK